MRRHRILPLRLRGPEAISGAKADAARELRSLPHRQLLLSPSFTPAERARYDGSGFECVDIHDMARDLGNPAPEASADQRHANAPPSEPGA